MNEFLPTIPFDLYELSLFRLVLKFASFTKAAEAVGLTQSAITRQIQGMEERLGLPLLERTTRSVRATPAGEYLHREAARLLGDVDHTLRRLREEFAEARKVVRVGISQTISLAHLPGFFHANLRLAPQVGCQVTYQRSTEILGALEASELDLGVICPPPRLPRSLVSPHQFSDTFSLIVPRHLAEAFRDLSSTERSAHNWFKQQEWLLITDNSNTGQQLRAWMKRQDLEVEPKMQLDSFDLIINLVALGLGVSLVPTRSLALYGRKRNLQRLPLAEPFVRQLVVVARRQSHLPEHVQHFISHVLF